MDVLSRSLAVLALACAVAVGTAGSTASTARATATAGDCSAGADWGTVRADFAAQTVDLVNAHLAALGLRQLAVGSALQAAAVWKARHMAMYGYMAHDDPAPPVSRSTGERMAACGVAGSWGENIAAGFPSPASVVQGWLNSPGHRANIENPNYVSMGAGAAASASGQLYWAHTFSSSGSGSPPPPPPVPTPPSPPPAPGPAPTRPPGAGQPAPKVASAANPLTFRRLTLTPRRPAAGHVLGSKVIVMKGGARLKTGHVFCSARLHGRRLEVLRRRLRAGSAACAWRLPPNAHGSIASATVVVQQGRLRAQTPFRVKIS